MKEIYFDAIMTIERLHRLFLEVVRVELDRMKILDISNVQCFILYNIGENQLTVGEVTNRGYYLGSNVTYNLKKMVENGYLTQIQSTHDKRSSHIKLSSKGLKLFESFDKILMQHTSNMKHNGVSDQDLKSLKSLLQKLESFWGFAMTHDIRL
ncbi:MAG: MarR family winged helix-turn-helix transcriptional regulator [Janthinobacterium lividum]